MHVNVCLVGAENNYKAVGVVFARMLYRDLGVRDQESVRDRLGAADLELLERATASTWVSIVDASRVFDAVASQCFSADPDPIFSFGAAMAKHNLTTIYRTLLRVMGPNAVVAQYGRIWGLYHREGAVDLLDRTPTSCIIQVRGHSGIPHPMRVAMAGWIHEGLMLAGAERVWSVVDDSGLPAYRWRIRWRAR